MPTFTAVAFDRLIEPGAAKSMVQGRNYPDSKHERRHSTSNTTEVRRVDSPSSTAEVGYGIPPNPKVERAAYVPSKPNRVVNVPPISKLERGVSVPPNTKLDRVVSVPPKTKLEGGVSVPPNSKLERGVFVQSHANLDKRNGAPTSTVGDKENHWTQISPALYATPASTPLPDSPSSFPPSPYIINHKRRGPRLMKSSSEHDVAAWKNETEESKVEESESKAEEGVPSGCKDDIAAPVEALDSATNNSIQPSDSGDVEENRLASVCIGKHVSCETADSPMGQNNVKKSVFNLQQDDIDGDLFSSPGGDLFSSPGVVSAKSIGENEGGSGVEQSLNSSALMNEFYDAWEGAYFLPLALHFSYFPVASEGYVY